MRRLALCLLAASLLAAAPPLPEDRGLPGLTQALRRLTNTARVLYITAHPDDEDGGTITWLTRGRGIDVTLLSLTRGEAGANLITADFFDSLSALRTLELLRAAGHYACRVRFTSFADYGYSKNVAEAWRNWDREKLLADVVRIVRQERPHVILARWQGTSRDGHGHHEAAGLLAQLAFDAAGDPRRFPDQIAAGLPAWQPLKLYSNNRRQNDDWTVSVDSGAYDPVLGRSYAQIARDGLRWQRSQGAGAAAARPGPSLGYYKLLASSVGAPAKENSFFERIEDRIASPAPPLDARDPAALWKPLAAGLDAAADDRLREKYRDAIALAAGLELEALVAAGQGTPFRPVAAFRLATPGATFRVATAFHNRTAGPVEFDRVELIAPPGWSITPLDGGLFEVTVPEDAQPTKAFWRRDSVSRLDYQIDRPGLFGLPLPPSPLIARAHYRIGGVASFLDSAVRTSTLDSSGLQNWRPLLAGPALSVAFASDYGILPVSSSRYEISCSVRNLGSAPAAGQLRLELPAGWQAEPASAAFSLEKENQEALFTFRLTLPREQSRSEYKIAAFARSAGRDYRAAFLEHTYPGLDSVYLERNAVHTVRRIDVKVAPGLRIGYVMGTGDDVPAALRQLAVPFDLLDPAALAAADLSRYSSILLGIRAYAARPDVKTHNSRLLDYVEKGGTLIVQYNTPEFDNNYGPYPYQMGRNPEEVSEENSPITILEPDHPLFHSPNRISAADFEGWIEQRGSKFWTSWDPRYTPLLETHDTGQAPQKGGWLVARHGKGLYVYCAYAWYRQLPFAVPGAARLFANLISLGLPK